MSRQRRVRIEVVLALLSLTLGVFSLFNPQWIENLFETSPDAGSGSAEWSLALAFGIAAVVFAVVARFEWRRLGTQVSTL